MNFITSLFGGEGSSLFTALFALGVIVVLVVSAIASLGWLINRLGGSAGALAWQSHKIYELPLSVIKHDAAIRVREVEVRNLGGKRVSGLIVNLSEKPTSMYSNTSLEEINVVGGSAGYSLKLPYLDPDKSIILRLASVEGDPAQVLRVVADNVQGKAVDFSKESINWGVAAAVLICIGLAYLLGVRSHFL